jgi:hypothetical protein
MTYLQLINLIKHQRAKRNMVVLVARVCFLRVQGWAIVLVYIFKPKLARGSMIGPGPNTDFYGQRERFF